MTGSTQAQIDDFARRLRVLEAELDLLRRQTAWERTPPRPSATPARSKPWPQSPVAPELAKPAPGPLREPVFTLPELELEDLFGARALAIAGGVVTLLGIVFFFILAVNRGWIGPIGRIGLGAFASTAVFLAGVELRRRYGTTHAALAAVGAGIAGGYATLLAAASLYDLVPSLAALAMAAVIATVAVLAAIRWRAQLVAGLGLIGAMLVPVAVAAQGNLSALGTAFAGIVLIATAFVALREHWTELLVSGLVVAAPQIAAVVLQADHHTQAQARSVLLAAAFSLVYLAIGIACQLRRLGPGLGQLVSGPLVGSAVLAAGSAAHLFTGGNARGTALVGVAIFYATCAAVLYPRRRAKDVGALLAAIAFTIAAVGLSQLLCGPSLAYAWAAEAVALAWLARRTREVRFQIWSAVYLLLALAHMVVVDAPPTILFAAGRDPLHGAPASAAVALAALPFALQSRPWAERFAGDALFRPLDAHVRAFQAAHRQLRATALWLSAVAATYTLSLAVLAAFSSFAWGQVAVGAIWSATGLIVLLIGLARPSNQLRLGGLVWLGTTGVLTIANGAQSLGPAPRGVAFLALAVAYLAAALSYQLYQGRAHLTEIAVSGIAVCVGLSWYALTVLLNGRPLGGALLALGLLFAGLTAALRTIHRQRDFASLTGLIATVVGAAAAAILLDGTYLVLAWGAAGAAIAWLSARTHEPRLLLPAAGFLAAATGHALVLEAPPADLFAVQPDPAAGVPALLIAALAIGSSSRCTPERRSKTAAWWTAGVLGVYAASLTILELTQRAFPHASIQTDYQRGHTTVSAFWGLLGLVLLYAGLTRWRSFRIAGSALFLVSLAKIFLYDLPALSSLTRALSFLAVGAVLLLGGFFYQHLTARRDKTGEPRSCS